MKMLLKTVVLTLLFGICGFSASCIMEGCATSNTGKLAQTEAVIIPTVNTTMGAWKAYVDAGKATPQQIADVQVAYNAYYSLQLHAEAALLASATGTNVADQASAQAAVSAAEGSLTSLVTQYTK